MKIRFDHRKATAEALEVNSFEEGLWEKEAVSDRLLLPMVDSHPPPGGWG